jgi:hypothetical protein
MKKIILVYILFLIYSVQASAGNTKAGTISLLHFMKNGAVLFTTSGLHNHLATDQQCVLSQPRNWALSASTNQGKVQLSGLLSAFAMGKKIVVYGTGNCDSTVHSDRETVDYFYIQN